MAADDHCSERGRRLIPRCVDLLLIKNRLFVKGVVGVAFVTAVVIGWRTRWRAWDRAAAHDSASVGGGRVVLSRKRPGAWRISREPGNADRCRLAQPGDCPRLQAPVLSIGGAGTFDGVFLTGILAVLFA